MLELSGSIVLYKSEPDPLKKLIKAFLSCGLRSKLYLIDNSPTDVLRVVSEDPRVVYIFNHANVGFGAGHNIAIRHIWDETPYVVVLNPDILFDPAILDDIRRYMNEHTDIGLLMPKVFYPDGSLQYLCKLVPTPADLFLRRFLPRGLFANKEDLFQLKFTGYNRIMDVPYLSGCFMFLRTAALKECGLFDERFFMYPEDIDLTRRIHRRYRTVFYPNVSIVHEHGAGSYKSVKLLYIHVKNIIKYFNKWGWIADSERREINRSVLNKLQGYE